MRRPSSLQKARTVMQIRLARRVLSKQTGPTLSMAMLRPSGEACGLPG